MPQVTVLQHPEQLSICRLLHRFAVQAGLVSAALKVFSVAFGAVLRIELCPGGNRISMTAVRVYALTVFLRNTLRPSFRILCECGRSAKDQNHPKELRPEA